MFNNQMVYKFYHKRSHFKFKIANHHQYSICNSLINIIILLFLIQLILDLKHNYLFHIKINSQMFIISIHLKMVKKLDLYLVQI